MLRRFFWVSVGAAAALQADRWMRAKRSHFTPNALTGTLLNKINSKLEASRSRPGSSDRSSSI